MIVAGLRLIKLHVMPNICCFITVLVLITSYLPGQNATYFKVFTYPQKSITGTKIFQDTDGNFVISGHEFASSLSTACVIKITDSGNIIWSKKLETAGPSSHIDDIIQTRDSNYVFALINSWSKETILVKMDRSGDTLWTRTYDHIYSTRKIMETADSGLYLLGLYYRGSNAIDLAALKTDAGGNMQWCRIYSSQGAFGHPSAVEIPGQGYLLGATFENSAVNAYDAVLIKTDLTGNILWSRRYDTGMEDISTTIETGPDGNILIGGLSTTYTPFVQGTRVLKTDTSGAPVWDKLYTGMSVSQALDILPAAGNAYYVAGTCQYPYTSSGDMMLIRINSSGAVQYTRVYLYTFNWADGIYSLTMTRDGGLAMTGGSCVAPCGIALVKTDIEGMTGCYYNLNAQAQDLNTTVMPFPVSDTSWATPLYQAVTINELSLDEHVKCSTVGTEKGEIDLMVSVYPNPFSSIAVVSIKGLRSLDSTVLMICDMQGRVVNRIAMKSDEALISANDLGSGIYLYHLEEKGVRLKTGKIIVLEK
jgi:hypothetical protein